MHFEKVYEEYKIYAKSRHKKQGFTNIVYDFNAKILPYFKDYLVEDITCKDYLDWQNYILSKNYKNSYNIKLQYAFTGFYDYCSKFYNIENIARKVGPFPKKNERKSEKDFYTYSEFKKFISGFTDDEIVYKVFFDFMFFIGTRPGETMALRYSDIKDHYVYISNNCIRRGNRELDTPKNSSSVRKVILDKKIYKEILSLKDLYIKEYGMLDDYFVFGGIKPLSPTTIDRKKDISCKRVNIRPIDQHEFRHSNATFLLELGIPVNEVSRRLGHSKISTTLDVYTHVSLEQEKRVIKTLNSFRYKTFAKKFISILKH